MPVGNQRLQEFCDSPAFMLYFVLRLVSRTVHR